ncbi:MAG: hypothetical protein QW761_00220 [Candidatus Aenigmatarchaeota archaeon]
MSESPTLTRVAIIMKDSQPIAYTENFNWASENDIIKKYQQNSQDPAVLEYGNRTFTIAVNRLVVGGSFWTDYLAGTKMSLEIRPEGTGAGKPKYTFSECVIRGISNDVPQGDVITQKLTLEAKGLTVGSQS